MIEPHLKCQALQFTTVRLPFECFVGYGPGADDEPLDTAQLRRLGILAIGRDFIAELAVSSVRFY